MYFSNVYGQFKIATDQFKGLDGQPPEALREAARQAGWGEDSNGSLLSETVQLRLPDSANGTAEQVIEFPWKDAATRATAFRAAQAHLLVFDLHGASQRGDVQVRLSGHVSGTRGQPLYLFQNVPRPLAVGVGQDIRDELRILAGAASVLAYRIMLPGEDVRTLEMLAAYLPRKRHIQRIKSLQVYDHRLKRKGDSLLHEVTLRSLYDADTPGRQRHETTLGSSELSDLMLHALSAHDKDFYAEAGNAERVQVTPPTVQARKLYTQFRPEPQVPPVIAPPKDEKQKLSKKEKKAAALPTEPQPPVLPVLPPEPVAIPELASSPPPLAEARTPTPDLPPAAPAADPWVTLGEQIVVDDDVLRQARAALDRCRPLLLRGAPGTGKTLLARGLAEALCGPGNFTLVTADARWTSADVIGGLRVAAGVGLQYAFSPGIVTRAATRHLESMAATGRPHALIIDEFNRANQDEAFGRLLTLLDGAYRTEMPLVGVEDGAPEAVHLPRDFLLIATMNDADAARLHEIGAALSRRFVSVRVGIPRGEQTFLAGRVSETQATHLEALYDFVGTGQHASDLEHGRLRAFVPVGTYFMQEVLATLEHDLTLDETLGGQIQPLLPGLSRDALTALHGSARRGQLAVLSTLLEETLAQTHF